MFHRNLAVISFTAALLSMTGAAHAAMTAFPSAAEEGSVYSVNDPLPAASGHAGESLARMVFPSPASEGSETTAQTNAYGRTLRTEVNFVLGPVDAFPSTSVE